MIETLSNLGTTVATGLGYLSGMMTCVYGIVCLFKAGDSKFGHSVAAVGLDIAKLRALWAGTFTKDGQ